MDEKLQGLLKHSLKNHHRRGPDQRDPWLRLITKADTTKIIRATAATTINQVGTEGLDFSSLAAAQRSDAVSAKRAFWHPIAAKFAIIISGLQ
jgi:hypothetical protein